MKKLSIALTLAAALGVVESTNAMFRQAGARLAPTLRWAYQYRRPLITGGIAGGSIAGYSKAKSTLKDIQAKERDALLLRDSIESYPKHTDIAWATKRPLEEHKEAWKRHLQDVDRLYKQEKELEKLQDTWQYRTYRKLFPWMHRQMLQDAETVRELEQKDLALRSLYRHVE